MVANRRIRALIADDHDMVRAHIREIISERPLVDVCGFAKDGAAAVEKARELKPDLVILDISMPGLNGLEAATQIRQVVPHAIIVMLSMHESLHLEAAALKAGADAIISKALAADVLLTTMDRLLSTELPEANLPAEV